MRFQDQVAVVTGAGRGLGRAIALGLASEGAAVTVADIDRNAARRTADEIESRSGRAKAVTADVATLPGVEAIFAETIASFGDLHILVNNAGILVANRLIDYTLDEWRRQMSVNVKGVFFCLQAAARIMIPKRRGAIVNLSSTGGFVSSSTPKVAYDTSKGAVRTLTISAAAELAPYGIRVNAIAPGTINTEMSRPHWDAADPEYMKTYMRRIPLGRLGTADDIVPPVLFLCSSESQYVTGHVLVADGGWLTI